MELTAGTATLDHRSVNCHLPHRKAMEDGVFLHNCYQGSGK
jgi:hypothetical protein